MTNDEMAKKLIQKVHKYKKGKSNLKIASLEVSEVTGLWPEIAAAFLKHMKRDNVSKLVFKNDALQKIKSEGSKK